MPMTVGPSANCIGGEIAWSIFVESGEDVILVKDPSGEVGLSYCVALWPPAPIAGDDHVWLKTWSQNEGAPEALEKAGVVILTPITCPTGYSHARLAKLTPEAIADRDATLKANPDMAVARQQARLANEHRQAATA